MRRRTFLVGAALATALGATGCGGPARGRSGPVGDPRPGGTLVLQLPAEITNGLNPLVSSDPTAMGIVSGSVYSKLLEFRTGPGVTTLEIVPDLAESWEISPDGLTTSSATKGRPWRRSRGSRPPPPCTSGWSSRSRASPRRTTTPWCSR